MSEQEKWTAVDNYLSGLFAPHAYFDRAAWT